LSGFGNSTTTSENWTRKLYDSIVQYHCAPMGWVADSPIGDDIVITADNLVKGDTFLSFVLRDEMNYLVGCEPFGACIFLRELKPAMRRGCIPRGGDHHSRTSP